MNEELVYYTCLNHNYHDEKLEPVLDVLYEIIKVFDGHLNILVSMNMLNNKNAEIKKFMSSLLPIMERIVKDNKYETLPQAIKIINDSANGYSYYGSCLELLYYPEDLFNKDEKVFYLIINNFCEKKRQIPKEFYPFKFVDYINELANSYYLLGRISSIAQKYVVTELSHVIVGYAYIHNMDASSVFKMIDYITNNYQLIDDYLNLNYDCDSSNIFTLRCSAVEMIASACEGNEKVIS